MTKEDIIEKWGKEMVFCKGVADNKKEHSLFRIRHSVRESAISEILNDLKKLNVGAVSKEVLLDFAKWLDDNSMFYDKLDNYDCVDAYLKSIKQRSGINP
jgi:hypothetical protein